MSSTTPSTPASREAGVTRLSWSRAVVIGAAACGGVLLALALFRPRRGAHRGDSLRLTGPGQFARYKAGTFWATYAPAEETRDTSSKTVGGGADAQTGRSVRQHEITTPQPLLDAATGDVANPGFARRLYWAYTRAAVRAPRWRVKEWDYYYIANETHAVCLTFANLGFIGCLGISLLSFEGDLPFKEGVSTPFALNKTALVMMPFDKMVMHGNAEFGVHTFTIGDTMFQFESVLESEMVERRARTEEAFRAGPESGRWDGMRGPVGPVTDATNETRAKLISSVVSPPPLHRPRTHRVLCGRFANMFTDINGDDAPLAFSFNLDEEPEDTIVVATPFAKKRHFYYNQKINGMTARGSLTCGHTINWSFARDKTAEQSLPTATGLATLDWGRGVWTYDNTWYWASLQTRLDSPGVRLFDAAGQPIRVRTSATTPKKETVDEAATSNHTFGFNLGYGFGDTRAASENMLFFKGIGHKLDEVRFLIPSKSGHDDGAEDGYVGAGPWLFTSSDGRLELHFDPLFDRGGAVDLKVMCMIPHQVFGYYSGRAILDDGTRVVLDRVSGFAEKVHNRW